MTNDYVERFMIRVRLQCHAAVISVRIAEHRYNRARFARYEATAQRASTELTK